MTRKNNTIFFFSKKWIKTYRMSILFNSIRFSWALLIQSWEMSRKNWGEFISLLFLARTLLKRNFKIENYYFYKKKMIFL